MSSVIAPTPVEEGKKNQNPFEPPVYDVQDHVDALNYSGYSVVPNALPPQMLDGLRNLADQVAQDYGDAYVNGLDPRTVGINNKDGKLAEPYKVGMARCAYLWGGVGLDLLDLDIIHQISEKTVYLYELNDLAINTAFPDPINKGWGWHRDYPHHMVDNDIRHLFLWFFFLLDDFTADNGATWVVPGTHRRRSGEICHFERVRFSESNRYDHSSDAYPTKQQILGKAGDLLVMDANMLHSAGKNLTDQPRRAVNVRICYQFGNDQCDHWEVAGERIQKRVSDRVARIMHTRAKGLPTRWPYYPPVYDRL